jgi:hypothetical protein
LPRTIMPSVSERVKFHAERRRVTHPCKAGA